MHDAARANSAVVIHIAATQSVVRANNPIAVSINVRHAQVIRQLAIRHVEHIQNPIDMVSRHITTMAVRQQQTIVAIHRVVRANNPIAVSVKVRHARRIIPHTVA